MEVSYLAKSPAIIRFLMDDAMHFINNYSRVRIQDVRNQRPFGPYFEMHR